MRLFRYAIAGPLLRYKLLRPPRRTYLSDAFACHDAWDNRLKNKIFDQVNSEVMYFELDGAYSRNRKLAAVDVDVFVNAQQTDAFLTEVEEFVHRLRLAEETGVTLPTTHHAVIRLFLKHRRYDDLVRILHDRLNYGIFPDNYCTLLLLDHLLKAGDLRNAAKVATLDMFQEDYSHQLVKYMSLVALHKYLLTDQLWNDPIPTPVQNEGDEEEEEVKVRIPFLRNPFFDNHFDLTDGNHICGKSLLMIGSKLDEPICGRSYRLMGLALFNLWDNLERELGELSAKDDDVEGGDPILHADALEFVRNFVKHNASDDDKANKLVELLDRVGSKRRCVRESLLATVETELKKLVREQETDIISNQQKVYGEWEALREKRLAEFLAEMLKRKRLEEVELKKKELHEREELMYFFDNEDEIEKVVETKTAKLKRRMSIKEDDVSEDKYVPPEVHQRSGKTVSEL